MIVKIKLLENGKIPFKQTEGSAGYDLFAGHEETILPNQAKLIKLGFMIEIPKGFEAQIRPRSGLALKNQLAVLNSPGTIDSDYRNEVGVLLMNFGTEAFLVEKHMRIAQMVFAKAENVEFEKIENVQASTRDAGWGSTGVS